MGKWIVFWIQYKGYLTRIASFPIDQKENARIHLKRKRIAMRLFQIDCTGTEHFELIPAHSR